MIFLEIEWPLENVILAASNFGISAAILLTCTGMLVEFL